ncbi:MAG: DUF4363 family protein [Clostridiales bacterium]|nr:DUF4363 family protein [Clostridiales bacterium]
MTKNIWAGLIALVLVITCGVLEVVLLSKSYEKLASDCEDIIVKCENESLTVEEYNEFRDKWLKLREKSELLLPHIDVYEINLRFAEGQAYAEQQDFEQLKAQLTVVAELLDYVPHLMTPSLKHIV